MQMSLVLRVVWTGAVTMLLLTVTVSSEVKESDDATSGTINFKTPTLNDEESHSMHMPSHLKCDACIAIVFQISKGFSELHHRRKSLKMLPESEIYRIVEEVCTGKELENYGVKEIKGAKRLSGPGLDSEGSPGIMQGGGKWPDRMKRMCHLYVEEFDENIIYNEHMKGRTILRDLLCYNKVHPGLTDVCLPMSQNKEEL